MIKSFLAILTIPLIVMAIDAVNPPALCDRFVTKSQQKSCQKKMTKIDPDSYLAAACEKQFSDEGFWNCLELSNTMTFDPKKMDECFSGDFSDTQRVDCLKRVAVTREFEKEPERQAAKTGEFQRMPANSK